MRLTINESGRYVVPDDLRFGSPAEAQAAANSAKTDDCPQCGTATRPALIRVNSLGDPVGYWTIGETPQCATFGCGGGVSLG